MSRRNPDGNASAKIQWSVDTFAVQSSMAGRPTTLWLYAIRDRYSGLISSIGTSVVGPMEASKTALSHRKWGAK